MTDSDRSLATRLRNREFLVGLVVKMPAPGLVEAAGHTGWDLVLIDTEHGAADTLGLEEHLRAADSAGIAAVVRVAGNRPDEILRALDAGAAGVVVPHIATVEQAQAAARAAHYPPDGSRSLATSTRAGRHSTQSLASHLEQARRETVVIVQIEDRQAVAAAHDIATTPHVDAVWLGPTDLSLSLGRPGEYSHPEVSKAVDAIVEGVTSAASAALCVLVESEQEFARWRDVGASVAFFASTQLMSARLKDVVTAKATLGADAVRTPNHHEAAVSVLQT